MQGGRPLGTALEVKGCRDACPPSCPNDCSGHGTCSTQSAACVVGCAVSCECEADYHGADCSLSTKSLQTLRDDNEELLGALSLAREQVLGDPDCEFHEQTTDNLVSIIAGDPYGLPERLVKSLFQDFAGTVASSSYQDCLQEGTLAGKSQQVSFEQPLHFTHPFYALQMHPYRRLVHFPALLTS